MRVITKGRLAIFWEIHEQAKKPLEEWYTVVSKAEWTNLNELRRTYPSADLVKVKSGNMVTVFNIGGNKYRLVVAIHYNSQRVFVREILTHDDYDKDAWKERS